MVVEGAALKTVLKVAGLDCADCAAKLAKAIERRPGVTRAEVSITSGKMVVEHQLDEDELLKAIKTHGYDALIEGGPDSLGSSSDKRFILTALSAAFMLAGVVVQYLTAFGHLSPYLYLPAIILGGYYISRAALASLKAFSFDMNVLMSLAVLGAMLIGEWLEGAAVVLLFSVGNTLQTRTMNKTRKSIKGLMDLTPDYAIILEEGKERRVSLFEVKSGSIVLVRPGDKLPVDGEVLRGHSAVDQSPITGESLPVDKTVGDAVFAGTLNVDGYLEVEVKRLPSESTLSGIIRLVEEAQDSKAPVQHLVDVFAGYYTPVIMILAALTIVLPPLVLNEPLSKWFYTGLVLLVIACPCALVISTPVSLVAAIGNAARKGVLIKGGSHLEKAGKLNSLAFDKTGTLTKGQPAVKAVIPFAGVDTKSLLAIAASLEALSNHPLADAVLKAAKEKDMDLFKVQGFKNLSGKGALGIIDGKEYYIGSARFFKEVLGSDALAGFEESIAEKIAGYSYVLVGTKEKLMGLITFEDLVRPEAKKAVGALKSLGIRHLTMLTGDNRSAAARVADELGIEYQAELLPRQKLQVIEGMKAQGTVAMVGDGINDAPALAVADLGIAMGMAGTDTALETASVALMADDLAKVPFVIRLSRRTVAIIKQNIAFSVIVKLAFVALALAGKATLWMAVFADTGAAVLVILNGMRLLRN